MDEPQAEVLEEGRAAPATAPECARGRLSRRQGLVVVRLRARERRRVPACGQTRVQSASQSGAQPGAQPGSQSRVSGFGNSPSATSTRVKIQSAETPTGDRCAGSPAHRSLETSVIAASITERNQRIFIDLFEHRILTTIQLYELHFRTYPRARKRLLWTPGAGRDR
jgi:hypothetical protein